MAAQEHWPQDHDTPVNMHTCACRSAYLVAAALVLFQAAMQATLITLFVSCDAAGAVAADAPCVGCCTRPGWTSARWVRVTIHGREVAPQLPTDIWALMLGIDHPWHIIRRVTRRRQLKWKRDSASHHRILAPCTALLPMRICHSCSSGKHLPSTKRAMYSAPTSTLPLRQQWTAAT